MALTLRFPFLPRRCGSSPVARARLAVAKGCDPSDEQLKEALDEQISQTDPDARSMATSGRGTGIVGYNVQTAVDTKNHMMVAHDVLNVGHDRTALGDMARQARETMGKDRLLVLADRGYLSGEQILACERDGNAPAVPKPLTSGAKFEGRFDKRDAYRCPAGKWARRRTPRKIS
jgi:hypothetical protein